MLNEKHSEQRRALRKIHALQLQILRLKQKHDRTGGENAGGLEGSELGFLTQLLEDLREEVGKSTAWARPLCLRLKPKKKEDV